MFYTDYIEDVGKVKDYFLTLREFDYFLLYLRFNQLAALDARASLAKSNEGH